MNASRRVALVSPLTPQEMVASVRFDGAEGILDGEPVGGIIIERSELPIVSACDADLSLRDQYRSTPPPRCNSRDASPPLLSFPPDERAEDQETEADESGCHEGEGPVQVFGGHALRPEAEEVKDPEHVQEGQREQTEAHYEQHGSDDASKGQPLAGPLAPRLDRCEVVVRTLLLVAVLGSVGVLGSSIGFRLALAIGLLFHAYSPV